jgi:hypothetical protein
MSTKKPKSKKNANESLVVETSIAAPAEETVAQPEPATEVQAAVVGVGAKEKVSNEKKKSDKTKVIRDSFSFPEQDYQKISELKKTCLTAGVYVKKSEILRAGLHLLSKLDLSELKQVVEAVEKVQTGRPSASKN